MRRRTENSRASIVAIGSIRRRRMFEEWRVGRGRGRPGLRSVLDFFRTTQFLFFLGHHAAILAAKLTRFRLTNRFAFLAPHDFLASKDCSIHYIMAHLRGELR